jgi:hypothetical protein
MSRVGRTKMSELAAEEPVQPASLPPDDKVLLPRRALYLQAVLGVALAGAAFALGYAIGRGNATPEKSAPTEAAVKPRVWVEGKVTYSPASGAAAGDAEAVIFVLPEREFPLRCLDIEGIGPREPAPADSHPTLVALRQLGGAYARAGASGQFSLVVPKEGKYHVLAISAHVSRPAGSQINEADLIELDKYFRSASGLIGEAKYRWIVAQLGPDSRPLEIDFGRDGEP